MDKPIVHLKDGADAATIIGRVVDALILDAQRQGLTAAVFVGRCVELQRMGRYTPTWLRVVAAEFVCTKDEESVY